MSTITLSPPAEGTTILVPAGQSSVVTVSGSFTEVIGPRDTIAISVAVGTRTWAASVDLRARSFRAAITLASPDTVDVMATMHTRRLDRDGRGPPVWDVTITDSNVVRIIVQDAAPDPLYVLGVRCVDSGGRPLPLVTLAAFDQDPGSPDDPLGERVTTAWDGSAQIRFRRSSFAGYPGERNPDVYFRAWFRGRPLVHTLPGEPNDVGVLRELPPRSAPPVVLHIAELRGYAVDGAIRATWLRLGGPTGLLGLPTTDRTPTPDGRGQFHHFEHGSIYWTPGWGAYAVYGLIRQRWAELGWERSALGFPVSDELPLPNSNGGRYSLFEHGIITWAPGQAQAVVGAHHYERIYAELRAQILARCFALGATGRRNLFASSNRVRQVPVDPSAPDPREPERVRWRIAQSEGENPLIVGSLLHIALAIEHAAGNAESGRALEAALATFASLFGWAEPGAETTARLPQRWDAGVPTDRALSEQFLDGGQGAYAGSLAARNLHHYARRPAATLDRLMGPAAAAQHAGATLDYWQRYRARELSMDELTGLVTTYWIIGTLSQSSALTNAVRTQASLLGNYLADHGYMLVRPMGGLSFRGATGVLPALEHPFSRALMAVTGTSFAARTDFTGAMTRAGYWPLMAGGVVAAQALGWTLAAALAGLGPVAATLGLTVAGLEAALAGQIISPGTAMAALAVSWMPECFDVNEVGEVAAALLFRDMPNKAGLYRGLALAQARLAPSRAWSAGFHPWIGLTGLLDADPTVRDTYLAWYTERQAHPELETDGIGSRLLFATSVAALLSNAPAHEASLLARLDHAIVAYYRDSYFHPQLVTWRDPAGELREYAWNSPDYSPVDFLAATAVAFWHARRRADAGTPVTTPGFPAPLSAASFARWPTASVPVDCLSAFQGFRAPNGEVTAEGVPIEAIQGTREPVRGPAGCALFAEPTVARHAAPAPPAWDVADRLMCDVTLPIAATEPGDLATGVTVFPGHEIEIQASGLLWWGGIFDPENGPEGLLGPVHDASWPLHTGLDPSAQPHSLLGRLNGYFRIGPALPRTRWVYHDARPLFLRLNHLAPGPGHGHFDVRVRVWGPSSGPYARDPALVFRPINMLRDGGVLRTSDPADLIEVTVTAGAVASDAVEFQLTTPGNVTARKQITIRDSPSTGTGSWTIWTDGERRSDANGLYTYQLPGATLTFAKAGLGMHTVQVIGGLEAALPGSRVAFAWVHD